MYFSQIEENTIKYYFDTIRIFLNIKLQLIFLLSLLMNCDLMRDRSNYLQLSCLNEPVISIS